MAHYRKIDVSIWNDEKFSSMKTGGKFAYLFLITHPFMTAVGAMRASVAGLSDESGATSRDFNEVFEKGLALFDEKSKSVFLPNFLRYQASEKLNPNIVKGWVRQSAFVPESFVKELALRNVLFFIKDLSPSLCEAFHDQFAKETGSIFAEEYGEVFSKEKLVSFGKIIRFLPQSFLDFFTKPVSSKVNQPSIRQVDRVPFGRVEPFPTPPEIVRTSEVAQDAVESHLDALNTPPDWLAPVLGEDGRWYDCRETAEAANG